MTTVDWGAVYRDLVFYIQSRGIVIHTRILELQTTGTFDGLSIITNGLYDTETQCHNIAHSVGHIAQWSINYAAQRRLYDELYAAKDRVQAGSAEAQALLETSLNFFRAYEVEASSYGTWVLRFIGHPEALPAFTNFARADITVIIGFHRDGKLPEWGSFFADWNQRVAAGTLKPEPFPAKEIPPFKPIKIGEQEVIRNETAAAPTITIFP